MLRPLTLRFHWWRKVLEDHERPVQPEGLERGAIAQDGAGEVRGACLVMALGAVRSLGVILSAAETCGRFDADQGWKWRA